MFRCQPPPVTILQNVVVCVTFFIQVTFSQFCIVIHHHTSTPMNKKEMRGGYSSNAHLYRRLDLPKLQPPDTIYQTTRGQLCVRISNTYSTAKHMELCATYFTQPTFSYLTPTPSITLSNHWFITLCHINIGAYFLSNSYLKRQISLLVVLWQLHYQDRSCFIY